MKVTFIYADFPAASNSNKFNIGIAVLSAFLKQHGFKTSLIHLGTDIGESRFVEALKAHSPDVLAFSYNSNIFKHIRKYITWAEILDIPKIHGGLHPTISPDECLSLPEVRVICRGEGEHALLEFCQAVRDGKDYAHIENLWVKTADQITRNPIRPLIENLDDLPFLDYSIFNYQQLSDYDIYGRLVFMASRGCPYNCTYCCNHLLKKLYPNSNKYVRFKSAGRFIAEIKAAVEQYPGIRSICFFDDTLTLKKEFIREFSELYKNEIKLPYTCNDRVNQITAENLQYLKSSGCTDVALGIESGNDHIRNEIMKRNVSCEEIVHAFRELKRAGIKTSAFNIVGVPGETMTTILDTIRLNALAKPDRYINAYFNAYVGTDLYNYCLENNLTINETGSSLFDKPTVSLDSISETQIQFFYKYFAVLTCIYKILYALPQLIFKPLDQILTRVLTDLKFPHKILGKLYFFDIAGIEKVLKKSYLLYRFVHYIRQKIKG